MPKSQTHWRHSGFESDFRTVCPIEWIWRRAFIFRRFLVVLIFIVLTQQKFIDWHVKCFYERIENGLTNVESHFNIAELHTSTHTHTHAFHSLFFWTVLRLLWIALCLNLRLLSTWPNIHFRALDFRKKIYGTLWPPRLRSAINLLSKYIMKTVSTIGSHMVCMLKWIQQRYCKWCHDAQEISKCLFQGIESA